MGCSIGLGWQKSNALRKKKENKEEVKDRERENTSSLIFSASQAAWQMRENSIMFFQMLMSHYPFLGHNRGYWHGGGRMRKQVGWKFKMWTDSTQMNHSGGGWGRLCSKGLQWTAGIACSSLAYRVHVYCYQGKAEGGTELCKPSTSSHIPRWAACRLVRRSGRRRKHCQQKGSKVEAYWLNLLRNWLPVPSCCSGVNDQVKAKSGLSKRVAFRKVYHWSFVLWRSSRCQICQGSAEDLKQGAMRLIK